jgi:two-component system CheB/CheR fusion protein
VQRRDQFLAILSHELRNPLGAVLNASYVLEKNCKSKLTCKQPCQVIERQTRLMARLLDDLLDVSRVMLGKIDMRLEPCDLRKAVEAALEVVRPQIDGRDQQFLVDVEPTPLTENGGPALTARAGPTLRIWKRTESQIGAQETAKSHTRDRLPRAKPYGPVRNAPDRH